MPKRAVFPQCVFTKTLDMRVPARLPMAKVLSCDGEAEMTAAAARESGPRSVAFECKNMNTSNA